MKKTLLGITCFFTYILSIQSQTLYGITFNGGSNGGGTINKFMPATNKLTVPKSFESFDYLPYYTNLIQASDGKFYGMTLFGGNSSYGIIFSFDPSSSNYKKLKGFDYTNGANPYGSLMQASDGKLYGMTTEGGSSGDGVIFSFDPSSSIYTKLKDFDYTNGASPSGSLLEASDGKLYGMTSEGGSGGYGVIFSFDPLASDYTNLKDFDYTNGGYPYGSLIQAGDGKLYGMASEGGNSGYGVIFSLDPSSFTYTKQKDFDYTNGANPYGSLMHASDGKLYGMTVGGGSSGDGVIFSFNPSSSTYTKLENFDSTNGANPYGSLVQASDGKLYGMTAYGEKILGGSNGPGVIFSYDLSASTYTKLRDFDTINGANPFGSLMQASDGKLYGMTSYGGSSGYGVIFSFFSTAATYTKLKDFGTNESGSNVSGSLMKASNGKLYGMTVGGGSHGVGVIFSFDPPSSTYTKLKDFDNTNGANPYGSLVQTSDGKLYGMTLGGGSSGHGVIFSFDPSSSIYTKLMDFDNIKGGYPYGGLIQARDGKLYGMTTSGGNCDPIRGGTICYGVIFSYDPSSFTYRKLKDFDYDNGSTPYGDLMQASDGKLYGMTSQGGNSSAGVIFSFDPYSSTYKMVKDFDYSNGGSPFGSLMQARDGKLYGMTISGGSNGAGVIFSFAPATSTYAMLKDFDNTNGLYPYGNLMQASDGKLYGMTISGGSNGAGTIFSFVPSTSTYTKLKDYNGANGAAPYFGSAFIEVLKSSKPLLTINDATVYETAGLVTLTVTLSQKTAQTVSVKYTTVNGTAKSKANGRNPADYIAKRGTVIIPAGLQTATISIIIKPDNVLESTEKFYVKLGKPVNATIARRKGKVTIFNGYPLNTTIVITSNVQQVVNEKQKIANKFILKASPNPSSSQFTLKIETGNTKQLLNLRVVDLLGKVIEERNNIFAGQTLQIGNNYRPGVYVVEVMQGKNKKQLRLLKLPN